MLQAALDRLDPRFKEALLLVFLQGLTCRQAADELGVPLGTVLSRLYRAREFLKQEIPRLEAPPARFASDRRRGEASN